MPDVDANPRELDTKTVSLLYTKNNKNDVAALVASPDAFAMRDPTAADPASAKFVAARRSLVK